MLQTRGMHSTAFSLLIVILLVFILVIVIVISRESSIVQRQKLGTARSTWTLGLFPGPIVGIIGRPQVPVRDEMQALIDVQRRLLYGLVEAIPQFFKGTREKSPMGPLGPLLPPEALKLNRVVSDGKGAQAGGLLEKFLDVVGNPFDVCLACWSDVKNCPA
jgi:hypothetical protein